MSNTIATMKINEELNGVELYFSTFPIKATRDNLKKSGFRWNHKKSCWYAKRSEDTEAFAAICADTTIDEYKEFAEANNEKTGEIKVKAPKGSKKVNKYGVKVGDFFSASWGWEQTNVNFFQVIALVGESSVRVREVHPPVLQTEAVSGMSEDRTYDLSNKELLPPSSHSVFINDQEKGDLKRLKSYRQDGTQPQFYLTSYTDAYYCSEAKQKEYVSWYA